MITKKRLGSILGCLFAAAFLAITLVGCGDKDGNTGVKNAEYQKFEQTTKQLLSAVLSDGGGVLNPTV